MRQSVKVAAALASAALVAACGGASNVLLGKSPAQIIQLAVAHVGDQSFRLRLDSTVHIDASGVRGLPAAVAGQIAGSLPELHISGKGDVQSPQRVRFDLQVAAVGISKAMAAVLYDGHYYISLAGNGRYADAGTINLPGLPLAAEDIKAELQAVGNVTDLGEAVRDGVRTEHLRATLSKSFLIDLLGKATGSGAEASALAQLRSLFAQVVDISNGTVDAYVRTSDGRLEAENTTATLSVDMAKLVHLLMQSFGGRIPAGSGAQNVTGALVFTETSTETFSDYGAHITVTKPAVDPNAPSLPPNLFGGGM